jgi:prevent-host-death family protein
MMFQVGAFEAKNTLGSLLDRVENGEEVLITRHGKPVARLVPNRDPNYIHITPEQREKARAAMERMTARAKDMKLGPFDWEEWKKYRDEGRP